MGWWVGARCFEHRYLPIYGFSCFNSIELLLIFNCKRRNALFLLCLAAQRVCLKISLKMVYSALIHKKVYRFVSVS